jgi:diguanylate cyclase (GGDEF)-like protein
MMASRDSRTRSDRRVGQRRRSERWGSRARFVARSAWYGFVFDVVLLAVVFVTQRRTRAGLRILSRRLTGEPEAVFPRPRFLGNGNIPDFEQLSGELEEIRRTDRIDVVTGLANQVETRNMLQLQTEVAARDGTWLSACIADLDHFKEINDNHGHAAGDEALRQLGDRFRVALELGQPIGRWGGDEFLLLLPQEDLGGARDLAERVRRAVEVSPFLLANGTSLGLTVTLGVASGHGRGLDADLLFQAADGDLLEAKKGGRNRVGPGRALTIPAQTASV